MFKFPHIFRSKKEENVENTEELTSGSVENDENTEQSENGSEKPHLSGSKDIIKLTTDLDRIKAAVESFSEVRKSLTERISGISEQIGELRAMILDRDRTMQELELKAVKASDLVESVQPEKLMIEIQREDAKFEALKANLEGNESIMNRIMDELKEIRRKVEFFRGIEEVVNLSEEVKKELIEIKKVEALTNIHADKIQTIYSELKKKYQDIEMFNTSLQEFKVHLEQNSKDIDNLKFKISSLADKEDFDKLVQKVQRHMEDLKELNRTSSLSKDVAQLKNMLGSSK